MDRYRYRDYDSAPSRDERQDESDTGFSIRGAAKRQNSIESRPAPPRRGRSRSRSPPPVSSRRPYRDLDQPEAARSSRSSRSYYHPRTDDRYDAQYSSSSGRYSQDYSRPQQYHSRYSEYYEEGVVYDDPIAPPPSNGDSDVSTTGDELPFLLIRGLKANTSESLLSKGLEKLYIDEGANASVAAALPSSLPPGAGSGGLALLPAMPAVSSTPPGASPNSLKRVFLIRDRDTEKGLTYGFAEYHSVADARAALAKAEYLGDKCTISSKKLEIGYPHMGVFPAVLHGQETLDSKYMFQFKDGTSHRYHDARYYASVLDINMQPPSRSTNVSDAENVKKSKKRSKDPNAGDTLDSSAKKAKVGISKSLGIVDQWNKKKAELRGEPVERLRSHSPRSEPDTTALNPPQQSYVFEGQKGGKQRKACLLCATEIPKQVTAAAHVLGSKLHAANLLDEAKCQKALQKIVEWAGITPDQTVQVRPDAPEKPKVIRDRAKERREQEARTGTTEKLKVSLKDVKKGGPVGKPVEPSYGKGMAMLQKAGWKEGQGLGSGGGISAPIQQISYNAGVGLGHEGSKKGDAVEEATRMTRDDGGFLEKTKEVARQRFERM